jgi:hypothetical protein
MEKENMRLQAQVHRDVKEREETDNKTTELLGIFDEVSIFPLLTVPAH